MPRVNLWGDNVKKLVIAVIVVLAVLGVLFIALCLYAWERDGVTKNAEIVIGESAIFEQSDFEETRDVILEHFKGYINCELIRLVYDEEFSEEEKRDVGYPDDFMVWYSDFQTGHSSSIGFSENSFVQEWKWVMRKSDDGEWQVISWGLG